MVERMKKRALRKEFYMEIRRTLNRFLSIFLITMLGVAFFAGIRAAKPDMQLSADSFYDEANLMDIQVLGTLGMTRADAEAIAQVEGVKEVMPYYSVDMFCVLEDDQINVEVDSWPEKMNYMTLKEGRRPENAGECLADERLVTNGLLAVGDTLTLKSGTDTDTEDILASETFTVVGTVSSPIYLSLERGTTSIGDGTLDGFLVLEEEAFSLDYYTSVCLTVEGASELTSYTDAYDDWVDEVVERVEAIADARCELRYAEVQQEGRDAIAEAEQELADAEQELADAEQELTDGRQELADAKTELADGYQELLDGEQELADGRRELADAKAKVGNGWIQADRGRKQIKGAEDALAEGKTEYEAGLAEYEAGRTQYEAGLAEVEAGYEQLNYEENYALLTSSKASVEAGLTEARAGLNKMTEAETQYEALQAAAQAGALSQEQQAALAALQAQIEDAAWNANKTALETTIASLEENQRTIEENLAQLGAGKARLDAGAAQLAESKQQLDAAKLQLAEAKSQLDAGQKAVDAGNKQIGQAVSQLCEAEDEITEGEQELLEGEQELADGWQEYYDGEQKLADAEQELADGEAEYADAKAEADEEMADARVKIADAKQELEDLELPEWYVLDRQYLYAYVDYGQNADRIGAIGEVFPVLFFLVAALVCLTTMTRMVEEERTQIGTLKALGYSKGDIAAKYILYALISSLLGSLAGLAAGQKVLPYIIITAYQILYVNLPEVLTPLSLQYSVMATAAAVLCTTAAAWGACYKELFAVPAELMRPASPKAGRRVLLERLNLIWRHLNFSQKATVRNLMRYKKRFLMTVFGIGGCMALLLVGFGVKDSISFIGTGQFGSIFTYDSVIAYDDEATREEKDALLTSLGEDERIESGEQMLETALDAEANGTTKSAYLIVPSRTENLDQYIVLRDRLSHEEYSLDSDGIIITEKLSDLLDVSEGDTIVLKEDDTSRAEAVVEHIVENYYMHYIYMDEVLYEQLFGEEPEWNMVFTQDTVTDTAAEELMQSEYMGYDAVAGVTFVSGTADYIDDMLQSMDGIIWVLVFCAGLLAFVVLYNLNNINISERKRELATLKVLGFFDGEVSSYVNRENVMLTLIGIVAGVFLGTGLHQFVIQTAETDTMMFGRTIELHSYIYSILLTLVFAVIVAVVMHFKLKKINMVESLKSVE